MIKRKLGQSDIAASAIALGTWQMGGWMWGQTDKKECISTIHAALDAGINLIDTAPIYGFGLSEIIVGKALKERRDRVVLATKCGLVCDPAGGTLKFNSTAAGPHPDGHIAIHEYLGRDSIRKEIEGSLTRLQTDYIDLYQTHWQDETTPSEEVMEGLMALKKEGKIRAIGVSNATSEQMQAYQKVGPLDCDQERFSMIDRKIEKDQLPYCREQNMAVLAYSPLAHGLLTGKIGPDIEFAENDLRRTDPRFSQENRKRIRDLLDTIHPVASAHNLTLPQLVVAWTTNYPGVSHVLCGARHVKHIQENAEAGEITLNEQEMQSINKAVEKYFRSAQ